jgi:hypothetical protein
MLLMMRMMMMMRLMIEWERKGQHVKAGRLEIAAAKQ